MVALLLETRVARRIGCLGLLSGLLACGGASSNTGNPSEVEHGSGCHRDCGLGFSCSEGTIFRDLSVPVACGQPCPREPLLDCQAGCLREGDIDTSRDILFAEEELCAFGAPRQGDQCRENRDCATRVAPLDDDRNMINTHMVCESERCVKVELTLPVSDFGLVIGDDMSSNEGNYGLKSESCQSAYAIHTVASQKDCDTVCTYECWGDSDCPSGAHCRTVPTYRTTGAAYVRLCLPTSDACQFETSR